MTEGDDTRPGGGCTLTTDNANLCTAEWIYDAGSGMMRRLADGWGTVFKVWKYVENLPPCGRLFAITSGTLVCARLQV